MCPDALILSAFFDNELPMLKQHEVEIHLNSCTACQMTLKNFKTQHQLLRRAIPPLNLHANNLSRFHHYMVQSKSNRKYSTFYHRGITIPLPVMVAILTVLIVSITWNFIPVLKTRPSVILLSKQPYTPPVVSITITPNAVDRFLSYLDVRQGFESNNIHTLPIDLPITEIGEPQIIRISSIEKNP